MVISVRVWVNIQECVLREDQLYPDDPERLKQQQQLVCREALTGPCYWEVEWRGELHPAVTDRGIRRSGDDSQCCSLNWSENSSTVRHKVKSTIIPVCSSGSDRVSSVYLDCSAAALSFYTVSADTLTLLHSTTSSTLLLDLSLDLLFSFFNISVLGELKYSEPKVTAD